MAKFCPECGKQTIKLQDGNLLRDACPDKHFIQYARTKIDVGAMIIRDESVLLVERGIRPKGIWTLISGHIEENETLDEAIIREVQEEVGIEVTPIGVIFIRNMQEHGKNDLYVIFLCTCEDDAVPVPDGIETTDAKFLPFDEIDTVNASRYTRWFVQTYLEQHIQPWTWHPTDFDERTTRIFTQAKS